MSDWQPPRSDSDPVPATWWAAPAEDDPLGPGRLIRQAWRLYRSAPRRFLTVAAVPALLQGLLSIPAYSALLALAQTMFDFLAEYLGRVAANPEAYRNADPRALQTELEGRLQAVVVPGPDLLAWSAVGGGLATVVGLVGVAALTATALAAASGRPVPAVFAFRLVAARRGLVIPIVVLGIGWAAATWLPGFLQTSADFQAWAGAPGSPRSVRLASLLSVFALVVLVAILVVAVRWALYVPAVLVEALGVGPGLARAAELTRGIRIRLGLAMAGLTILVAIAVAIGSTVVGFAVGFATLSVPAGFAAYLTAAIVGNLLAAPMLPAVLALAYRERTAVPAGSEVPDPNAG